MRFVRSVKPVGLFMVGICAYVAFRTLLYSPEVQTSHVLLDVSADPQSPRQLPQPTKSPDPCSLDALAVVPVTARKEGCTDKCQSFTCKAILFSNRTSDVHKEARQWMKDHPVKMKPDEDYMNTSVDCARYRLSHGFHMEAVSPEEADFPIAFNIIMHRDIQQIERVFRAIYRPHNVYCIHVDAKQKPHILKAMRSIASCFDNVLIASKLERVTYAGYSRLQADINCMDDLHNRAKNKWKYLINIAGQSFPLKTNLEMVQTLKVYNGSNDIEGIFGRKILRGRFENEFIEINTNTSHPGMKKTKKKNPKPPYDIDIVRGSAYGIFSRGFVGYILNDKRAQGLLKWSRTTWSPDEHYWATLHHLYTNPHLHTPGGYPGKLMTSLIFYG